MSNCSRDPLRTRDIEEPQLRALFLRTLRGDGRFADATAQDIAAVFAKDPACRTHARAFLNYKVFQALQAHRFAHWWWRSGRQELVVWLSNRVSGMRRKHLERPAPATCWTHLSCDLGK
ncbi:MAG: hypothetical protein AAGA50_32070 [Pseudomonadota bacterium]